MRRTIVDTLKEQNSTFVLAIIDRFHAMKLGRDPYNQKILDQLLSTLEHVVEFILSQIRTELHIFTVSGIDRDLRIHYLDLHLVQAIICDIRVFITDHNRPHEQSCCIIL